MGMASERDRSLVFSLQLSVTVRYILLDHLLWEWERCEEPCYVPVWAADTALSVFHKVLVLEWMALDFRNTLAASTRCPAAVPYWYVFELIVQVLAISLLSAERAARLSQKWWQKGGHLWKSRHEPLLHWQGEAASPMHLSKDIPVVDSFSCLDAATQFWRLQAFSRSVHAPISFTNRH